MWLTIVYIDLFSIDFPFLYIYIDLFLGEIYG